MVAPRDFENCFPDREIELVRVINAPRQRVFDAFADPKHLAQWWGPDGFTTTTERMEFRPGGVWRFCMHGPDGRDYQNMITYEEIVPPERIVYKHGGDPDCEPVNFRVRATFEEQVGKTKVTLLMVFASPEEREFVITTYGAIEGGERTLARLEQFVGFAELRR